MKLPQNNEDISTILNMLSSNSTTISAVPIENLIILTNSILKKIKKIDEANENLVSLNWRLKALIMSIKTYKIDRNTFSIKKEEIHKYFEEVETIVKSVNGLSLEKNKTQSNDEKISNNVVEIKSNKTLTKTEIYEIIKSHLGSDKTLENNFLNRIVNVLGEEYMTINDIMKKSGVAKFRVAEILNKCSKKEGVVQILKNKMADGTVGFKLKIN